MLADVCMDKQKIIMASNGKAKIGKDKPPLGFESLVIRKVTLLLFQSFQEKHKLLKASPMPLGLPEKPQFSQNWLHLRLPVMKVLGLHA